MEMNNRREEFYDIVKARSDENEKSLNLLLKAESYALIGAIIRMELDSLIRVHNFNNANSVKQEKMLDNFFEGKKWPSTDSVMVGNMPPMLGWAKHIYEFCCAFIHLSPYHDWASNHNIPNLTQEKRKLIVNEIKSQQNEVWGYDPALVIDENFDFNDLMPFAPHIFEKLRGNLLAEMES